ncbi:nuclear transcription factor Y subunit gamma isoform X2 [Agrilus planipennis]|uniref:Nuclear transcription factor Y subunit gamma n=1 Tax=Agrilus planipennis TaxID=224129 RepID=A0A1W4WBP0_AGRPL|nr:nuclear transcription factor Y subunit gamma isoform X2 [Agrilus planipennis]
MSVFFVNADTVEESKAEPATSEDQCQTQSEAQAELQQFWSKVMEDIRGIGVMDLKQQVLPLARIKKIMKLDEEVKMISAEAPLLFAKAAEIFIHELTLRAWIHTEDNKRRTLQRNDIAMAITKYDQFDFLIDIVPRDDIKPTKVKEEGTGKLSVNADQVHYYFSLAQQHQAGSLQSNSTTQSGASTTAATTTAQPQNAIQIVQPQVQTVQVSSVDQNASASTTSSTNVTQAQVMLPQSPTSPSQAQTGGIQIVQQIVTPSGEIQQIPIQLSPQQLQMIRMQLQNNTSQPLIIQAAPIQAAAQPQIIQLCSLGGASNSASQPVFITKNSGNSENE